MTHYTPHPTLGFETTPRPAHVAIMLRLADPADDALVRHVRLLRNCVALAQKRWEFSIDAAVVLPNEMQLLCAFQDADTGVRSAIRMITRSFVRHVPGLSQSVWSEFGEVIEVPDDLVALRRDFVETAPVRAGLVKAARDWPYSSANVGIAQGGDMGVAVA